jgi:hypothetical protein
VLPCTKLNGCDDETVTDGAGPSGSVVANETPTTEPMVAAVAVLTGLVPGGE